MVESSVRTAAAGAGCEITAEDYRRLHRQLHAQILRAGVSPTEVEDLIQETFLHAQKALDRGQFEGRSALDTWVVSIAKKRTLKYHRRQRAAKRRAPLVPLERSGAPDAGAAATVVARDPDPQVSASDRELLGRALVAIEGLPDDFRAPLVLSVDGHSYEQIAKLLGIPVSRVTSRIHQARAKLRNNLAAAARRSSR